MSNDFILNSDAKRDAELLYNSIRLDSAFPYLAHNIAKLTDELTKRTLNFYPSDISPVDKAKIENRSFEHYINMFSQMVTDSNFPVIQGDIVQQVCDYFITVKPDIPRDANSYDVAQEAIRWIADRADAAYREVTTKVTTKITERLSEATE